MKRNFFILSFLAILTFASSMAAFAGDLKRDLTNSEPPG